MGECRSLNFYMGCESAGNRQRTLEPSPNPYQQPLGTRTARDKRERQTLSQLQQTKQHTTTCRKTRQDNNP